MGVGWSNLFGRPHAHRAAVERLATCFFETSPAATKAFKHAADSLGPFVRMQPRTPEPSCVHHVRPHVAQPAAYLCCCEGRVLAAKAAAPYMHRALKSVEHSGEAGGPQRIIVSWLDPTPG